MQLWQSILISWLSISILWPNFQFYKLQYCNYDFKFRFYNSQFQFYDPNFQFYKLNFAIMTKSEKIEIIKQQKMTKTTKMKTSKNQFYHNWIAKNDKNAILNIAKIQFYQYWKNDIKKDWKSGKKWPPTEIGSADPKIVVFDPFFGVFLSLYILVLQSGEKCKKWHFGFLTGFYCILCSASAIANRISVLPPSRTPFWQFFAIFCHFFTFFAIFINFLWPSIIVIYDPPKVSKTPIIAIQFLHYN